MTTLTFALLVLCGASVCLAAPGQKLNKNVLFYEPLHLDSRALFTGRSSRDLHSSSFNLKFSAFSRQFDLELEPNTDLFGEGLSVDVHDEDGSHQEELLASRAFYRGQLADERSFAHFRIGKDGRAMGLIFTANEVYYVDPASHHFTDPQSFNHVVYRESDHVVGLNNTNFVDYTLALPPIAETAGNSHYRTRRSAYVSGRDTCEISLVADSAFYINEASSSVGISVDKMVQAFGVAQTVFGNSAFSYSIKLRIGGIRVYKSAGTDPYVGQTTPETYLAQFARTDWSAYCLAHAFTYTDFTGVLGLAYTGQVGHVGGICSTQSSDPNYINSAFASGLNFGNSISFAQRALVTAHELGHNFGANHDSQDSSSTSTHFVMYPYAVDGSGSNNYKFSASSISQINDVVAANGGCFKVFSNQTCGNAVQEGLEACDCGGLASSCNDTDYCCSSALDCTLKSGKQCSPLNHAVGKCCDSNCLFYALNSHVCAEATDCKLAAQCDGAGNCQTQVNKADRTLCKGSERYCTSGSCSTSICSLVYGAAECSLSGATDGCKIVCNKTNSCVTTDTLSAAFTNNQTIPAYNLTAVMYKSSGASCEYTAGIANSGYCSSDTIPVCVENNKEQTAIEKIKNFLGGLSVDGAISWAKETTLGIPNWAWLLMGLSIGVALLYSCCSKRSKDKKARTARGRAAAAPVSQANAKQQMAAYQAQQMREFEKQQQQQPGQFPMQPRK